MSIADTTSWGSEVRPAAIKRRIAVLILLLTATRVVRADQPKPNPRVHDTSLMRFIAAIKDKAKSLENSSGMRQGFQSFTSSYKLPQGAVQYSDYVIVRLLFEATRDAGFWNLHWTITDKQPVSDEIWRQWNMARLEWLSQPTATAECDELSALYAFLVRRAGVHGVGLFWPTYNHTVAVWEIHPAGGAAVRVVVPTSQIFLDETDSFGTRKFNPWKQKSIHEYTRRDAADTWDFPKPLYDFFLLQVDKYAGSTDATLQQIRYLRDGVFRGTWSAEAAARQALEKGKSLRSGPAEDLAAFQNFAMDMRAGLQR